jgi:hypothetical protein
MLTKMCIKIKESKQTNPLEGHINKVQIQNIFITNEYTYLPLKLK